MNSLVKAGGKRKIEQQEDSINKKRYYEDEPDLALLKAIIQSMAQGASSDEESLSDEDSEFSSPPPFPRKRNAGPKKSSTVQNQSTPSSSRTSKKLAQVPANTRVSRLYRETYDPSTMMEYLKADSPEDLRFHIAVLESALRSYPDWKEKITEVKLDDAEIRTLTHEMIDSIQKQLQTNPKGSRSSPEFSYTGTVTTDDIFYRLFDFEPIDEWQRKEVLSITYKLSVPRFETHVVMGPLENLGDGEVVVRWDMGDKRFCVSYPYRSS